jgi:drug/metabolite transporter (DMT)-like permease
MKLLAIPFFGALSEGVGTVIEKKIVMKRNVSHRTYNTFSFMLITLLLIPIILLSHYFFPNNFPVEISSQALIPINILLMFLVIAFSVAANITTFYAFKWEKMTEIEPLRLMQPLFTILLAFFIYSSERQTQTSIIILSIIASLALIFSHIKKHHFSFNKYAISAILGSLFFAIELTLSKNILNLYPPLMFYLIRCSGIFLVSLFIFKSNPTKIKKSTWFIMALVSLIWIIYRLLLYLSYNAKGLITTTLLFILAPVFIYIFSWKYLKEQFSWRNVIASIIIILCVALALYLS